ncbi:MAG TPA: TonB-dependent receptor plug domain-containing protein, partial [Cellvibrio sp.]
MKILSKNSNSTSFITSPLIAALIATGYIPSVLAEGIPLAKNESAQLETVVVLGHRLNQLGQKLSAAEGTVGSAEIANRPVLRTGEILEFVPGMVVTQHSGSGKANQYFLRGFNLDHGTDFNTSIDGMPVNMRTHGHGQGYTDLNFIIPELIGSIDYRKGAYYAEVGDFSGAGAASFSLKNSLGENLISATLGENNYGRVFTAGEVQ